ncbi:sushi, von Willebrand factor type A, EGF and pentraxin domain-containing protein 1-like [Mytilus californianus]|uniref:sushi, von Willebrand factor type A, EGF and pentraxin domain-containing protein 1-like n=1 Tax=Mytilus californianus TaxID=6549 RepID=UPI002246BD58|nr:sushi, von Willebrand factor type A, EGF and pentraxin domain-containing protein 1-like [Mytilus californianus]
MPVPGFYTFKSTLTDTCIDGRFLDKNVTKSYTCLQDNKWSEDILMCEAFCNQLQIPSNAKANSSEDYVQTVIAVTCDHYFVTAQNDTTQYVTCNETGMWDVTLKHCDVYLCDETPSLLHASKYLKDSNTTEYICDPYYSFSNGSQSRIITCDGTSFKWEIMNDICTRQDDLICYRSMTSRFLGNTMRNSTSDVLLEFLPRSQMSCSSACLKNWHCKGYNYKDDVCRLFNTKSISADLTSDVNWWYFEKSDEDLYSCI